MLIIGLFVPKKMVKNIGIKSMLFGLQKTLITENQNHEIKRSILNYFVTMINAYNVNIHYIHISTLLIIHRLSCSTVIISLFQLIKQFLIRFRKV